MKNKTRNVLKLLLKITVSGGALYFVFSKINIQEVLKTISKANYLLLSCAALFFALSKLIASYRLNRFFKSISIQIHNLTNLKLYSLGMFYNIFLPGGIGGDGYKIYLLNKHFKNVKTRDIFSAVLIDRISGMIALLILAIIFFGIAPFHFFINKYLFLVLIPIILVFFYFIMKRFFNMLSAVIGITTFQSLGVQLAQVICAFFILYALDCTDNTVNYLLLFLISSIVAVFPFTIGGAGAREITFLFGAQFLNLNISVSIALSLIFYLITMIISFIGIYFVFRPVGIKKELA